MFHRAWPTGRLSGSLLRLRCCGHLCLHREISGANAPLQCWFPSEGTNRRTPRYRCIETCKKGAVMRGVLLWLIGIPIPVIILLYVFKAM
jgi:hypothetical protein